MKFRMKTIVDCDAFWEFVPHRVHFGLWISDFFCGKGPRPLLWAVSRAGPGMPNRLNYCEVFIVLVCTQFTQGPHFATLGATCSPLAVGWILLYNNHSFVLGIIAHMVDIMLLN